MVAAAIQRLRAAVVVAVAEGAAVIAHNLLGPAAAGRSGRAGMFLLEAAQQDREAAAAGRQLTEGTARLHGLKTALVKTGFIFLK